MNKDRGCCGYVRSNLFLHCPSGVFRPLERASSTVEMVSFSMIPDVEWLVDLPMMVAICSLQADQDDDPPYLIDMHECGDRCVCSEDGSRCKNRVVQVFDKWKERSRKIPLFQRGRQMPLVIFRDYKKNWTVRTVKDVKAGAFVCEYVGEVR